MNREMGVPGVRELLAGLPAASRDELLDQLEPLGANQVRLWLYQQLEPASNAYNVPRLLEVEGVLDVTALGQALRVVLDRHSVLRSVLVHHRDEVRQVVLDVDQVLPGLVAEQAEETVALQEAQRLAQRPFDLTDEPPVRFRLYRIGQDRHLLALVFHHIAVDGWSLDLIEGELLAAYEEAAGHGRVAPREKPTQYYEFARWQRERLGEERLKSQLAFWRNRLQDMPLHARLATPALDSDGPGPLHVLDVVLQEKTQGAVARLVDSTGGSAFSVLACALQVVLGRFAQEPDIVLGTTTLNRKRTEDEGAVGFFVNTVALPTRLSDAPPFDVAVKRWSDTVASALSHDDVPYHQVLAEAAGATAREQGGLFHVAVELQDLGGDEAGWARVDLQVRYLDQQGKVAKFDLAYFFLRGPSGLQLRVEFDSQLFDERYVLSTAHALEGVLQAAAEDPGGSVLDLPLSGPLLSDDQRPALPARQTVQQLVRDLARHGRRRALSDGTRELDFGQMVSRAEAVAAVLRSTGAQPGTLVGLIADRTVHSVAALLGIWAAECAYVPIDPALPAARQEQLVQDAGLALVLGPPRSTALGGAAHLDVHADELAVDADLALSRQPGVPANTAYAIYTSGTTGTPKAALTTHDNVLNFLTGLAPTYRVARWEDEVLSLNAPLAFDVTVQQILGLLQGASMVIVPQDLRLDAVALVDYVALHGVTLLECIPSHLQLLLDEGLLTRVRSLRVLVTGGEALPSSLWPVLKRATHIRTFNVYGPTECTVNSTCQPVDASAARPSIGQPLPGVRCLVVDNQLQVLPYGAVGELCVAGEGVGAGYLGRTELTAARFVLLDPGANAPLLRVYRTGDKARFAKDGVIEYLGRLDDQVKIRGNRIELGEVNATLAACPGVRHAVTVVTDTAVGSALHAFVVTQESHGDREDLRQRLSSLLPPYMVPTSIHALPSVPYTTVGKVDHEALKRLVDERAPARRTQAGHTPDQHAAPEDSTETVLLRLWEDVLDRQRLTRDTDFFHAGGHSLLAARLISLVRRGTGRVLSITALRQCPTPRLLAGRLATLPVVSATRTADAERHVLEMRHVEGSEPLVLVHALGGDVGVYDQVVEQIEDRTCLGVFDGLTDPGRGQSWPSADAMLDAYASEVAGALPAGRCHLAGWSMGGMLAQALVPRLQAREVRVLSVSIWDAGVAERAVAADVGTAAVAVLASLAPHESPLQPAEYPALVDEARRAEAGTVGRWIARTARSRWGASSSTADPVDLLRRAGIVESHQRLYRDWRPPVVDVPLDVVWADHSLDTQTLSRTPWARCTTARCTETVQPATHHGLIERPQVEALCQQLAAFLRTLRTAGGTS